MFDAGTEGTSRDTDHMGHGVFRGHRGRGRCSGVGGAEPTAFLPLPVSSLSPILRPC